MEEHVDTYCGGYCGACPIFMATQDDTISELAAAWGKTVDEIICYGCKSGHVSKDWCRECFIKACCEKKGFDTCVECETYPCQELYIFQNDEKHPYHKEQHALLQLIKNEGMDVWLKTCAERWSCSNCKEPYNWDQTICIVCGRPVDGYGRMD